MFRARASAVALAIAAGCAAARGPGAGSGAPPGVADVARRHLDTVWKELDVPIAAREQRGGTAWSLARLPFYRVAARARGAPDAPPSWPEKPDELFDRMVKDCAARARQK